MTNKPKKHVYSFRGVDYEFDELKLMCRELLDRSTELNDWEIKFLQEMQSKHIYVGREASKILLTYERKFA